MKRFNNLKIGTKLLASFMFLAAIAGLIGWVGLSGVNEMQARSARMYADTLVPIRDLGYANAAFLLARTEVRTMLGTRDRAKRQAEQLVSALGFFRTGDTAAVRPPSVHSDGSLEKLQAAVSHTVAAPEPPKILAKPGVALRMRETGDRIDREFERF